MKQERRLRFLRSAGAIALAGLVSVAAASMGAAADAGPKAWWQVSGPSLQPAAAIGAPAKGCLAGGQALPLSGAGYEVMRPSRRRTFGHPQLIAFITAFAAAAPAEGWPGLLVGDLAQARGGPTSSGHRSHQSGLDVDIWLQPVPEAGITAAERETLSAVSVVAADGARVDARRWTMAHQRLIRTAASFAEVDRIFVNPAIKQALCDGAGDAGAGERTWLSKVRPWWGHDFAHAHPSRLPRCQLCLRSAAADPGRRRLRGGSRLVVLRRSDRGGDKEGEGAAGARTYAGRSAARLPHGAVERIGGSATAPHRPGPFR